jgi:hypothetical protein
VPGFTVYRRNVGVVGELPNVAEGSDLGTEVGVVRRLSSRGVPTYLELIEASDGSSDLVVVERFERRPEVTDEEVDAWMRDARLVAELEHDNVVRAHSIDVSPDEIRIASNLVDGERLSDLSPVPVAIALRILIDVLTGLAAIHKLKVASGSHRHKVIHGEVTSANVLVGLDGIARVLRSCRVKSSEPLQADQRADVFDVGQLLRRALAEALPTDDAQWLAPLEDVAARALETAPERRFPTATAMVTELRRIAAERLATTEQVASFVASAAGDRIAARRAPVRSSGTRLRTMPPAEHPTSGVEQVANAQPLPSLTRTLPPPAFVAVPANEVTPTDEVTPEVVELDADDLTTLPPSMPPEAVRVDLPSIPPAPSLGEWGRLVGADPAAFSLAPVADVTWPPAPKPLSSVAAPSTERSDFRMPRISVVAFAAAALAATSWSTLRAIDHPIDPVAIAASQSTSELPNPPKQVEKAVSENEQGDGEARRSEKVSGDEKTKSSPPPRLPVKSSLAAAKHAKTKTVSQSPTQKSVAATTRVPVTPAGVDLAGEFDRNAAMQALREAGDRARTCFARAGASGSLRVAVTFARAGTVTGAVVEGPLAGTSAASCVEGKFRTLRIPPFRGSSLTVRKTIAF